MRQNRDQKWFEKLEATERIELAKAKMPNLLGHFLYLLELHANNTHVVYSSLLSGQIPQSFAANAFNVFQRSMHQFEIVRLCALWDRAQAEKVNIPTVIELIGDDKIIDMLADEARKPWVNEATVLNDADMKRSELEFADEQAAKARSELKEALAEARIWRIRSKGLSAKRMD